MSDVCESTFKVGAGVTIHCVQHLGSSRRWKHSARYLGIRWYWTTAGADMQSAEEAEQPPGAEEQNPEGDGHREDDESPEAAP